MIADASPLEWAWTLLALAGVILGVITVTAALQDAAVAFQPPPGLRPTVEERALGVWITVKWAGITVCHVCNLIIGWRAMLNPPAPPGDPIRQEGAIITGLCLIAVELILVGVTFGQLYTRWLILKLHSAPARRAVRRPPVAQSEQE